MHLFFFSIQFFNMFNMIIFLIALTAILNAQIATDLQLKSDTLDPLMLPHNLGFPEFSGSCIMTDMNTRIIQIINDASQYQGEDVIKNIKYIKQQLDAKYGSLTQEFTISIQTKSESAFFKVLSFDKCSIKSLKAGVNKLFPEWSYLVYKTKRSNANFISEDGTDKGAGITNEQLYFFVRTIMNIEPRGPCDCRATNAIWNKLYQYDKKSWNLICSASNSNKSYFGVDNDQYASVGFNCVYKIYVGFTSP